MQCYVQSEKSISRKKPGSSIEKFPSLVLPGNTRTVTAPCYPISSLLSISCRLREVKNKRKFQTFCSKRERERGGRLQDVPNVVIWPKNVWYFGKLVAEERWSLTRGGRNRRFDCISLGDTQRTTSELPVTHFCYHFISLETQNVWYFSLFSEL